MTCRRTPSGTTHCPPPSELEHASKALCAYNDVSPDKESYRGEVLCQERSQGCRQAGRRGHWCRGLFFSGEWSFGLLALFAKEAQRPTAPSSIQSKMTLQTFFFWFSSRWLRDYLRRYPHLPPDSSLSTDIKGLSSSVKIFSNPPAKKYVGKVTLELHHISSTWVV